MRQAKKGKLDNDGSRISKEWYPCGTTMDGIVFVRLLDRNLNLKCER